MKPFLFKRDGYYHLQYFDEAENRIKRKSTREKKKNDALKYLTKFEADVSIKYY